MNNCNLSGRLIKNAIARGSQPRVLAFVLETRQNGNDGEKKERVAPIPRVIFNAESSVEESLTAAGKHRNVQLEGRLNPSSYEVKGDTRHTCEVIVRPWTLTIH